jgi:hypothetical protein
LDGGIPNPFAAFGAFSAPSTDSMEGLDGSLVVVLRKLAKRDMVTKIKALEELDQLVDKMTIDQMAVLMNHWPAVYARTSMDTDRRARLLINTVHSKLIVKLRKRVAPQLKELLGPWLNSVFDPNADVAKVARDALLNLFPGDKEADALSFARQEICQFCHDNIIIKTPETLTDPRYASAEEIASKYSRVISGCLYTLAYLLEKLNQDQLKQADTQYQELFANDEKFWSKLREKDAQIRRSFYRLIKTCFMTRKGTLISSCDLSWA